MESGENMDHMANVFSRAITEYAKEHEHGNVITLPQALAVQNVPEILIKLYRVLSNRAVNYYI